MSEISQSASPSAPIRIFYRISDFAQVTIGKTGKKIIKNRPDWFDKKKCLLNCLSAFPNSEISILADNIGDETYEWLQQHCPDVPLQRSNYGNGAASFRHVFAEALELQDDRIVYFLEDDYLHLEGAETVLREGFKYADYVTLFDHPDKYVNAGEGKNGVPGNPLITDESEETRVYLTNSTHWKITNAATMTFAGTVKLLKEDKPGFDYYCKDEFPRDYRLFRALIEKRQRKLLLPIPGWSAHCESAFLSPLRDWQSVNDAVKLA
jgi:hypothetical protein